MSFPAIVIKVIIASPGDVSSERELVAEAMYRWNSEHSSTMQTVLLPVMWEIDAAPELGDRPQAIINRQLIAEADMLIGLFWTRLGTPTGVAPSGTVEEIREVHQSGKPVMLYFSQRPAPPREIDTIQLERLRQLRGECDREGLVRDYDDLEKLRALVHADLTRVVRRLHVKTPTAAPGSTPVSGLAQPEEERSPFQGWCGRAAMANADGYWLSVVGQFPGVAASFSSSTRASLKNWILRNYPPDGDQIQFRPSHDDVWMACTRDGFETDWIAHVSREGVAKIQVRGNDDAIGLEWLLSTLHKALLCLTDRHLVEYFSGTRPIKVQVSLSNWPAGGICVAPLLQINNESNMHNRGTVKVRCYNLSGATNLWETTKEFATWILDEAGYLGHEGPLERLCPKT